MIPVMPGALSLDIVLMKFVISGLVMGDNFSVCEGLILMVVLVGSLQWCFYIIEVFGCVDTFDITNE